jgi:hypothetical protein
MAAFLQSVTRLAPLGGGEEAAVILTLLVAAGAVLLAVIGRALLDDIRP